MDKLKFVQVGPDLGDATANYNVEVDKECRTLFEFVAGVLLEKQNEWGTIYPLKDDMSWLGAHGIEYSHGAITNNPNRLEEKYEGWMIDRVTANGGWSRMDYYVHLIKADDEATKEPADERRDNDEATKEQQRREALERNVAESIRAVAEHVIASADNYAKAVDDYTQHISIRMEFNVDELPRVRFTQDAVPRTWINAVNDRRCNVWTRTERRDATTNEGTKAVKK